MSDAARLLAVQASPRKTGWTAQLLDAAVKGAGEVSGVEVDVVWLEDYTFRPCKSCFACIRSEAHRCVIADDMGEGGALFDKLASANSMIVACPVFMWGSSAMTRVFLERMYPFIWSGELSGMPFASISCASNSGFQYHASVDIARQVFNYSLRYMGCVPVHASYFDEGLEMAREKGSELAQAALADHRDGRSTLTDREKFTLYQEPWNVFESYVDNLTNGSKLPEDSMARKALEKKTFGRERALEMLTRADKKIQKAFELLDAGKDVEARDALSDGSALWTEATWREFLEEDVIGVTKPEAYRPPPEEEDE